jgi:deoxycytidine triphosphate deaminase
VKYVQLCDKDILRSIRDGNLLFVGANPDYPFMKEQIQPASVDLRLGNRIIRFKEEIKSFDIKNIKSIGQYLNIDP